MRPEAEAFFAWLATVTWQEWAAFAFCWIMAGEWSRQFSYRIGCEPSIDEFHDVMAFQAIWPLFWAIGGLVAAIYAIGAAIGIIDWPQAKQPKPEVDNWLFILQEEASEPFQPGSYGVDPDAIKK